MFLGGGATSIRDAVNLQMGRPADPFTGNVRLEMFHNLLYGYTIFSKQRISVLFFSLFGGSYYSFSHIGSKFCLIFCLVMNFYLEAHAPCPHFWVASDDRKLKRVMSI